MRHDAHGWWLAEAGPVAPAPPLRGATARMSSMTASWAGAVDAITYPERVNHASTPCSSHQAPIASTLSVEALQTSIARSRPKRSTSEGRCVHSVSQKPPLRPLGPWPQTSASSTTTDAPRSRSCQAAHNPV